MLAVAVAAGTLEIIAELVAELRVHAVGDQRARAGPRRQPAQVGQALLGDHHRHVVLGVVDMADHRHDRGNAAVLGGGRAQEDRQEAVAREVARAADAVHDAAAHDMGGIDVAVDVGLDHAVHADAAQPAHQLRVVGHFLRAHDDALPVEVNVAHELLGGHRAQREAGARGIAQHAGAQQLEHAVLDHLGECFQVAEAAAGQPRQHRIGNVAHARLQRQQVGRQAAARHFMLEELDQVPGDALAVGIGRVERAVAVRRVGEHHRGDLVRVAAQRGLADAVVAAHQRDRLAVRRQRGAVIDVVHAVHAQRLPRVDLDDHLLGQVQPGLVVAHRGGRHQRAVGVDRRDLDHRGVDFVVEAEPHVLGDVRQVDVQVVQLAGVDALARVRVALERHAHGYAIDLGQRAVQLRCGRGAGQQVDAELLAARVRLFDALGQALRHRLGVTGTGETAHRDGFARLDQAGGVFGGDDPFAQARVQDAFYRHGNDVGSWGWPIIPDGGHRRCSTFVGWHSPGDAGAAGPATGRFRGLAGASGFFALQRATCTPTPQDRPASRRGGGSKARWQFAASGLFICGLPVPCPVPRSALQLHQVLGPRARYRTQRNVPVEGHQPPAVVHRERQQVQIGQLSRTVDVAMLEMRAIQHADGVWPERMEARGRGTFQHAHQAAQRLRLGVSGLGHDAQATVLGKRTTGPAMRDVRAQPGRGRVMVDVVAVVQCDQHVHVEQRAHQMPSSSRRRSISSLLTTTPRGGSG